MTAKPAPRFLLVKHTEGWNVDRCTRWMESTGTAHDWCYPASGQAFPDADRYAGCIVFGGAPSANDSEEHSWVRNELAFIEQCLEQDVPFFGICLGAQMLARVLGSNIGSHPEGVREVGFHEVEPTEYSGGFLTEPLTVMQWHSEGFDLPAGCVCTARNDNFPNQAFALNDHVLGVQFHPEVNPDALAIWIERNRKRVPHMLDEAHRQRMLRDSVQHDPAITAWFSRFLHEWTTLATRHCGFDQPQAS